MQIIFYIIFALQSFASGDPNMEMHRGRNVEGGFGGPVVSSQCESCEVKNRVTGTLLNSKNSESKNLTPYVKQTELRSKSGSK
jgi:hypothetical protein